MQDVKNSSSAHRSNQYTAGRGPVLAFVAVGLRLLAHAIAHKSWTSSDYLIIAACTFAIGLQSISITGVFEAGIAYGHFADIVLEHGLGPITKLSQLIIPLQFLWVLSLTCTKLSILCLYLQIFPYPWIVWSSYATMSIIIAWTIATILAGCLICRPFAFNWDKTIPGGSCGDQVTSFTMATYNKMFFVPVFGLDIFTCVISALRISVLSSMDFTDITFTIPKANIFSGIEPCLAVVLASVPLMRPLLGRSTATPYGSSKTPVEADPKAKGPRRVSDNGFKRLEDDTGNLRLRPMGVQYRADVSALRESTDQNASEGDEELVRWHNAGSGMKDGS
ncbi:uncharacterized protein M421DRAFT_99757 [Didymella exigua CBS 183.55]|uniref:Rhodopsin domain-containing protein n=1 Tax=Didymella exigua CBS 183.55 TaxID=1150837 RepID=A0A6A5RQ23_9PLEO|nr:uncharacterized protein M421DRAFT_99757 [Didymella exigua CBS 183.55]KAF1930435.1 hypothetical protein M421DRAFT_99757 [Didymella exigua CBS 183.55]